MNADARRLQDLGEGLADMDIRATDEQLARTLAWLDAISLWNKVYNLTAIRNPREQLDKLVFDSLAALPFLRPGRILDIGSGAGAPGIPLAIFSPQNAYTLLDSVMKKAQFLERCVDELRLAHARALHGRVERLNAATAYDTIIARGVGGVDRLLRAGMHLARRSTRWILFKSAGATGACEYGDGDWRVEHINAPCRRNTLSLVILERT